MILISGFGEATVSASVYVKYGPQIASKVGFESGKMGGGYFQQEKVEWRCPTIPCYSRDPVDWNKLSPAPAVQPRSVSRCP